MNYTLGKISFWINKILKRNSFFHSKLIQRYEKSELWGLGIFILRGKSLDLGLLEPSKTFLMEHNFNIVDVKILSNSEITRISNNMRGTDWIDGLPVGLIVIFDKKPIRVEKDCVKNYPEMDNSNLLIKLEMRSFLNSKIDSVHISNFVHATDNSFKALKYLSLISDTYKESIIEKIKKDFIRN